MKRWLVTFRSHADEPADVHFVDVTSSSMLAAVRDAQRACPPHHPWAIATAQSWPRGCASVDAAVKRVASV